MTGLLTDKVAIVTGAGQGVGEGIARALADAGAAVVIAARRAENGEPATAVLRERGHEASFVRCDVSVEADVEAAIEHTIDTHGRLDIVVHNAVSPPGPPGPVQVVDPDVITAQIATSTTASYLFARAAHPHLVANRGTLILLTSPAGIEGSGNLPVYATVKGAQRGLLKSLAREWGPDGIRVNAIAPGVVLTDFHARNTTADSLAQLEKLTPLGRHGVADDIAAAAVYLSGSGASFVTGQTLHINGGLWVG